MKTDLPKKLNSTLMESRNCAVYICNTFTMFLVHRATQKPVNKWMNA